MSYYICAYCMVFCVFVYIFNRFTCGITRSNICLTGKTAIVTGAGSGLGYQTALNLASRGCKVIMADCKDMLEAKNNIIKFTNNGNILTKKVDLSSFNSIRHFASDILKTEKNLHILINNAGIAASQNDLTEDGLQPVMQVNYFGHVLLTHLLIDLLKKSAPSRIVFTSSSMAFFNNLSVDNLMGKVSDNNIFHGALPYCNSKFALLLASDMFAAKLKGTGVTSNSVHPGFLATTLLGTFFDVYKNVLVRYLCDLVNMIYFKSPWEGAQAVVHVAVSKKLGKVSGKYFWDCKPFIKPFGANNVEFCNNIWKATEEYIRLAPDERI